MATFLQTKQNSDLQIVLEQTSLGKWNDGVPVNPLIRTDDPFGIRGGNAVVSPFFDHPVCS